MKIRISPTEMQRLEDLSTSLIESGKEIFERTLMDDEYRTDEAVGKLARLVTQLGRITKMQTQLLKGLVQ